jgi:hypothetical protein
MGKVDGVPLFFAANAEGAAKVSPQRSAMAGENLFIDGLLIQMTIRIRVKDHSQFQTRFKPRRKRPVRTRMRGVEGARG